MKVWYRLVALALWSAAITVVVADLTSTRTGEASGGNPAKLLAFRDGAFGSRGAFSELQPLLWLAIGATLIIGLVVLATRHRAEVENNRM